MGDRLAILPGAVKEVLQTSLQAAIYSFPSSNQQSDQQIIRKAARLVNSLQFDSPSLVSFDLNIVLLQSTILLAIAAGNHAGTARVNTGPSQSTWLGSAIGLAYELRLYDSKKPLSDDPDSDERLCRRIWLSLVILDKWHASSMSSPVMIPDDSVVIRPEDQVLMGDAVYHLTRKILSQIFKSSS